MPLGETDRAMLPPAEAARDHLSATDPLPPFFCSCGLLLAVATVGAAACGDGGAGAPLGCRPEPALAGPLATAAGGLAPRGNDVDPVALCCWPPLSSATRWSKSSRSAVRLAMWFTRTVGSSETGGKPLVSPNRRQRLTLASAQSANRRRSPARRSSGSIASVAAILEKTSSDDACCSWLTVGKPFVRR